MTTIGISHETLRLVGKHIQALAGRNRHNPIALAVQEQ
jgi:hypothetical protein